MKSITQVFSILGAVTVALAALPAQAQIAPATASVSDQSAAATVVSDPDAEQFTLRLGAFLLSSINTRLALADSAGRGGQEVDFGRDLGGRASLDVFRADAEWRITDRHKIELAYFDINRSASKAITGSINWGDVTYPVNATVNSRFQTAVAKLNYGYTFFRNETRTQEITGLIGFHVTQLKASLSGVAAGAGVTVAEGAAVTAPLPVFGLEWKARLSDQFTSHVAYEYFGLSLDNKYTGNLSDFQAMLEYQMTRRWSLGAGYNRYTTRATITSGHAVNGDHLILTLRHGYNGLMLFVSTNF